MRKVFKYEYPNDLCARVFFGDIDNVIYNNDIDVSMMRDTLREYIIYASTPCESLIKSYIDQNIHSLNKFIPFISDTIVQTFPKFFTDQKEDQFRKIALLAYSDFQDRKDDIIGMIIPNIAD